MCLEITNTIKCLDDTAFMRAYNEALEIDRKYLWPASRADGGFSYTVGRPQNGGSTMNG